MIPGGEENSLEHILASELYPKKTLVTEDPSLQIPCPVICGESVEFIGKTSDGVIALSNFRLFVRYKETFLNIPLGIIESVECREIFFIHIYCKDAHTVRCTFSTNEMCLLWYKRLAKAVLPPEKLTNVFAFAFNAWCLDTGSCVKPDRLEHLASQQLCRMEYSGGFTFGKEAERMGFDLKSAWRITYINDEHKCCGSYPREHIVPSCVPDKDLESAAAFRACHRFPSVTWRDQRNGAVIARCSQPEVGWLGWRSAEDECLLQAISAACALNDGDGAKPKPTSNGDAGGRAQKEIKKLLILDARSYAAAVANRTKGGGCECAEYYPNCEIQFMSLANIHTIRKSFQAVRQLCAQSPDQPGWLTAIENTKWLQHISGLMRTALIVVHAIDAEQRPVLVHCSDGWDRTPQITSLSELLLDPFYRTVEGFRVLVEREWLAFGHKFADRCGQGLGCEDANERCPVFLQWLDCIHQLVEQFPTAFQFNEAFLVKLVQHTYSNLFGEFLCNTDQDRNSYNIRTQASSVWTLLCPQNKKFINLLYKPAAEQVLHPSCHIRHLTLWKAVYLSDTAPAESTEDFHDGEEHVTDDESEATLLPKTRSCDDLVSATEHSSPTMARRLSDPNIPCDLNDLLNDSADTPAGDIGADAADRASSAAEEEEAGGENSRASSSSPDGGGCATPRTVQVDEEAARSGAFCFNKTTSKSAETLKWSESAEAVNGMMNGDAAEEEAEAEAEEEAGGESGPDCGAEDTEEAEEAKEAESARDTERPDTSDCDTDKESSPGRDAGGHSDDVGLTCSPRVINGSTDTLTEEGEERAKASPPSSQKASSITVNGDIRTEVSILQNGDIGVYERRRGVGAVRLGPDALMMGRRSNMSTSTTDISDSHVRPGTNGKLPHGVCRLDDFLTLQKVSSTLRGMPASGHNGRRTKEVVANGFLHGADSDLSSRDSHATPGSLSPPTPGESKSQIWLSRQLSTLSRQLDCDGLTTHNDPVQQRLHQIESDYQQKVQMLERKLQVAQNLLCQYAAGCNGAGKHYTDNRDDILSTESADSGEHASLGGCSTAASDVSWEQIEDGDEQMTLWVPDHAVTHCAGCDAEFWIVKRKHHCRSCGQVFCNECTQSHIPVPHQQLNAPVRVCSKCYETISRESPEILSYADGAAFISISPAQ